MDKIVMKNRLFFNRYIVFFVMLLSLTLLSACSDPEVEHRKAFIDYLENTVMRAGNTLPQLSEDQKNKIGNYANDYLVLKNFSEGFNQTIQTSFNPMIEHLGSIKAPEDYATAQPLLSDDLAKIFFLKSDIEKLKNKADQSIKDAVYPSDLKVVYEAAYKKIIEDRANPVLLQVDSIIDLTREVNSLGNYLIAYKDSVNYIEGKPNFKTAEQAEGYNQLINLIASKIKVHEEAIALYNQLNQQ
ncbi:DUF3053 family protein [Thorsellia anophelis]|uniref:DUF3053 domain-containing protein n=1 Tax=Thorsellia anophelis DSM 18579 TaxID=1123402 RepID=A0A1I0DP66_9GAMM|nr:DUF3053 family protein [Thorsellia anophelis]SET33917.1 Protein of unknown function [Thorsellia anophelis DSM 18579]